MQYTYSDTLIAVTGLQLFADGGGAGAGAGAGATGGTAAAAGQQTGARTGSIWGAAQQAAAATTSEAQAADDPDAAFEALIKGDFKKQYDKRVSDTVKQRLKASKEEIDRYKSLGPTLVALASKYGVDPEDFAAINDHVQADESYWEDAAFEHGMDVKTYRELETMRRKVAEHERAQQEMDARQQADRDLAEWVQQAEALQDTFPGLDLRRELEDEDMVKMLKMHIPLETAYMAKHHRELVPRAVQYAAADGAKQAVNAIAAGSQRPREGAVGAGAAALTSSDVAKMTRDQREALIRRVQAGERITL